MANRPPLESDDSDSPPEPPKRKPKQELEKTEEEKDWDAFWADSDDELECEYESDAPTVEIESRIKALTASIGAGVALKVADFGLDLLQQELTRIRKSTVYITNKSSRYVLVNPRWGFKDGKTEKTPDFEIRGGTTGEALFQGQALSGTLKGMMTYEIAKATSQAGRFAYTTKNDYVLVILFRVLYFRGAEIKFLKLKFDLKKERNNKAGVKIVPKAQADLSILKDPKKIKENSLWHIHKDAFKLCTGVFHPCIPSKSKDLKGAIPDPPNLIAHFSISDTGEADVKIIVNDYDEAMASTDHKEGGFISKSLEVDI